MDITDRQLTGIARAVHLTVNDREKRYARGAEMIGWRERNPGIGAMREDGWLIGYGMGTALYNVAPLERTQVRLRLYASGRVRVEFGGQDIGTGTYTVAALTVADALSVPIDAVEVALGDTDLPRAGSSIAQASAAAVSSAAHLAARGLLRRQSTPAAGDPRSPLHQADPDSITARDAQLASPGGRGDPLGEVLRRASLMTMDVISEWTGLGPGRGGRPERGSVRRVPPSPTEPGSPSRRGRLRADPRAPPGRGVRRRALLNRRRPRARSAAARSGLGQASSRRRRPTPTAGSDPASTILIRSADVPASTRLREDATTSSVSAAKACTTCLRRASRT